MAPARLFVAAAAVLLLATAAFAIVDEDHDGYCEDNSRACRSDKCPGSEPGAIVDGNGCSCMQKVAADCKGEWCCHENPDRCVSKCVDDGGIAKCTAGTDIKDCGEYRLCPQDQCFSSQMSLWYDFPESGHDQCIIGLCTIHSCEPISITNTSCDYSYCEKNYGTGYFCGDYSDFSRECKGAGTVAKGSSCVRNGNTMGNCMTCTSNCTDSDSGIVSETKGTVRAAGKILTDTCTGSVLTEYYCNMFGAPAEESYDCSAAGKACIDGACADSLPGLRGNRCTGSCLNDLECKLQAGSKESICCEPYECGTDGSCVANGASATIQGKELRCDNGKWSDQTAYESFSCEITTDCKNTAVLSISDLDDGHASLGTNFENIVCCKSTNGLQDGGDRPILWVSHPYNDGHVSLFPDTGFPNAFGLYAGAGSIQCRLGKKCQMDETCLLSVSEPLDDAHVGSCSSFENRLCCKYYSDRQDHVEPMVQVNFDRSKLTVLTNEWSECRIRYYDTQIPCESSSCTQHSIGMDMLPLGMMVVDCFDKSGNLGSKTVVPRCKDGTLDGECSATKPLYCNKGWLIPDCRLCGCKNGEQCKTDSTCRSMECLNSDSAPGPSASGERYSLDDSIIRQTADEAVNQYSAIIGRQVDTADLYMESVAWYVARKMGYASDNQWSPPAATIIRRGNIGCGYTMCGDCDSHSLVRASLLRSLGVSPECIYNADSDWCQGSSLHAFNIVRYNGAYRIMDYGLLGNYFVQRWDCHHTLNVWNDYFGAQNYEPHITNMPSLKTYNYPAGYPCPLSGWTDQTYYKDVCP